MHAVLWKEPADPAPGEGGERRAAARRPVGKTSTMRDANGAPSDVGVYDLSATGARILTAQRLARGSRVRIGLPGVGAVAATVVRGDAGGFSCAWARPLSDAQLDRAFGETVAQGGFHAAVLAPAVEAEVERLSLGLRVAAIVGAAALLWTGILAVLV